MNRLSTPRRSVLYVPGSNARALEKIRTLPVDGVILDLEDGVAPNAKDLAREQACAALRDPALLADRDVLLRVNGPETPWYDDDIAAAALAGARHVLLPKVERPNVVRSTEALLAERGAPQDVALWCMIETPFGVLRAADIAASSPRLAGLVMGTSDLVKDLHAQHTPERTEVITALGLCVLAARAYGLAILDGVHLEIRDLEGFERSCVQGRALGFDGKTLIHPATIDIANRVFAPSADEVDWSRRVIDAHGKAEAAGMGVVVLEGRLIENLHVQNAHRIVALADEIERRKKARPS